jgi:group I intron endonuclease
LNDHLKGVSSNIRLQRSIAKSGITNFIFIIYYFHKDPLVILTDVETEIIKSFSFEDLYNFKKEAKSMLGYKHTAEAIEKMIS